jgi:hypothetical protein
MCSLREGVLAAASVEAVKIAGGVPAAAAVSRVARAAKEEGAGHGAA